MNDGNLDQCTAIADKTGERCRNPTRFGSAYCIVHLDVGEYFNAGVARRRPLSTADDKLVYRLT